MSYDKNKNKNVKGDTFYMTQAHTISHSSIMSKSHLWVGLLDLSRVAVVYALVLAESLLLARMISTFSGGNGSDLLTFTIYGLSYPIVSLFGFVSATNQIPALNVGFESATLWATLVILVVSLSVLNLLKIFRDRIK